MFGIELLLRKFVMVMMLFIMLSKLCKCWKARKSDEFWVMGQNGWSLLNKRICIVTDVDGLLKLLLIGTYLFWYSHCTCICRTSVLYESTRGLKYTSAIIQIIDNNNVTTSAIVGSSQRSVHCCRTRASCMFCAIKDQTCHEQVSL